MIDADRVTYSFMFRVSNKATEVKKTDRRLMNPKVGPIKEKQFEVGKKLFETEPCRKQCEELTETMNSFFSRH